MKLKVLAFVALVALSGFSVSAQTADEVVNKHIAALGGKDKLASLQSVRMNGNMNVQGNDFGITITRVQNTGMRVDMEIMGASNYQVVNTTKGSVFMPAMGMQDAQPMDDDMFTGAKKQLDIQGSLFNYKEKGITLAVAGMEEVEGNATHKLVATFADGSVVNYFIDKNKGFLLKTTGTRKINGSAVEIESKYQDYRQTADGYWFAFTNVTNQGTISFDTIETNVKVDPAIFN